ncbi:hypothetical protein HII12_002980 [Brettanomyces bruxellensis]|uniref:Uncharacterized protein n=1 Tax=Dekkera bruxellensis TaxID=5007 RepID=A0A8H6BEN1_DEKBR|nr:hypothetical protein HII12_002980 [Brettanomyces bruxellensis]
MWGGSTLSKILHPFQDDLSADSVDIRYNQNSPESLTSTTKRTNEIDSDEPSSQWTKNRVYEPTKTESSGLHGFLGNAFNWLKNGNEEQYEATKPVEDDTNYEYRSSDDRDDEKLNDKEYTNNLHDSFLDDDFLKNPLDRDVSETLNRIKDRERHWNEEQDTCDLLGLKYSNFGRQHVSKVREYDQSEVDTLILKLENNNELLLRMIENFDNATFKTDYKHVKQENAEISKKYFKLRKEFKAELQESKKLHRQYYELAKKKLETRIEQLKLRVDVLEKKDSRNQQEIDKLTVGRRQLLKSMLQRVKDNESSQQVYEDKLAEMRSHYLRKARSADTLRTKLEETKAELKALKFKVGYPSLNTSLSELSSDIDDSGFSDYNHGIMTDEPIATKPQIKEKNGKENLNEEEMNTVDILRQKYADKKYGTDLTGTVDTSISKPTINIKQQI